MNISDLHLAFKIELDKGSSEFSFAGNPAFLPGEIDYWLNKALIQVINTKFTGNNHLQQNFEASVKRIADLEKLVKTDTGLTVIFDASSNTLTLSDFAKNSLTSTDITRMFYVQSVLHFGSSRSNVDLVDHEQAKKFLKTYNNYPWIPTPVATLNDNNLIVYIDTATMIAPYSLDVTYIKKPMVLAYTNTETLTELPDYIYNEVVSLAVILALDNIESKRVENKTQLNTLTE